MARNLDPALLRSFVAVAESGSVTATAQQLNLTQAAVSQHIKRLEDQLEVALFHREGRRLQLAATGERLLARARRFVALNDEIWQLMRQPEIEGEVCLGLPDDLAAPYLPAILAGFDRAFPRVRVNLEVGLSTELLVRLAEGAIDLCLTTEQGVRVGGETLLREPLVWVQAHGGRAVRKRPLPVVMGGDFCCFRAPMVRALTRAQLEFRIASSTSQTPLMLAAVEADLAVAAILPSSIPPNLELVSTDEGLPSLPEFAINLYVRAAGAAPVIEEMAAHLRRHLPAKTMRTWTNVDGAALARA